MARPNKTIVIIDVQSSVQSTCSCCTSLVLAWHNLLINFGGKFVSNSMTDTCCTAEQLLCNACMAIVLKLLLFASALSVSKETIISKSSKEECIYNWEWCEEHARASYSCLLECGPTEVSVNRDFYLGSRWLQPRVTLGKILSDFSLGWLYWNYLMIGH